MAARYYVSVETLFTVVSDDPDEVIPAARQQLAEADADDLDLSIIDTEDADDTEEGVR